MLNEDDKHNIQALIDGYDDWMMAGQRICGRACPRDKKDVEVRQKNLAGEIHKIQVNAGECRP